MGSKPEENRYGLVFSEPHSVNLVDMDGDGLKDIVTGKTYWSHHTKSPMWDAGAVVYWFKLVRGKDGIDWVPYLAAAETGIGRQLIVAEINGDEPARHHRWRHEGGKRAPAQEAASDRRRVAAGPDRRAGRPNKRAASGSTPTGC